LYDATSSFYTDATIRIRYVDYKVSGQRPTNTLILPAATAFTLAARVNTASPILRSKERKRGREVGDMIVATRFQDGTIVMDRRSNGQQDGRPEDETTITNRTGRDFKSRDECGRTTVTTMTETIAMSWTEAMAVTRFVETIVTML